MSTFLELQNLVISRRFNASKDRPDVKTWINTVGARIWAGDPANGGAGRWSFADSDQQTLELDAGVETVDVPANLRDVDRLYDDRGDQLEKVNREDLLGFYRPQYVDGTTARPEHYAVVNRKLYLGPRPDADYVFEAIGQLVWGHRNSSGDYTVGDMTADDDEPYWDPGHHYVLVAGARAIGVGLQGDPTAPSVLREYQALLAAMTGELAQDFGEGSYSPIDPL